MSEFYYKTIQNFAEGIFTNKGSKFIGYVFPIQDEETFKSHLKLIKSKHTGARHYCYAWRLNEYNISERSNDDGEPSGTAGKPILNQLKSADVTNTGLIVVRYFGGTLLGTSGLIQAYKAAAAEALSHASVIELAITRMVYIKMTYSDYSKLMDGLGKMGLKPEIQESNDTSVKLMLNVPVYLQDALQGELERLRAAGCTSIELL